MASESVAAHRPAVMINGRFLGQPVTGVQRYGREVLAAMDELLGEAGAPPLTIGLVAPAGTPLPPLRHISARHAGRLSGHAWEQLELPWHSRGSLLWGLTSTGPLCTTRQCLTVHDAAVLRLPGTYSRSFRLWYRLVLARLARRVPAMMTVSRFSAAEAVACFGVPAQRLHVTLEGWQHCQRTTPDESVLARHGLSGKRFVLAVSSPTPNKNFRCIVDALALLGDGAPHCVVVGAAAGAVFQGAPPPAGLQHIGRVDDAELLALYRHASAFVFPSFYEGFGLPPLEAMAQGCPVLASTADAVREVCADAALYFAPDRPAGLARQLLRLLADSALWHEMSQAGQMRADAFSWRAAARVHLDVMQRLLRGPALSPRPHPGPTTAPLVR